MTRIPLQTQMGRMQLDNIMDFTTVFTRWVGTQGDDAFRELATLLIADEITKQTEAGSTTFAMPQVLLDLLMGIDPTYRWSNISRADFEEMMASTLVSGKLLSRVGRNHCLCRAKRYSKH